MKLLKKLLVVLLMVIGVFIAVCATISIWYYRRVCGLDSRFYSPPAEVVVRLVIERSFNPTLSFTVIRTKTQATLEACVLPDSFHCTFSYFTWPLQDKEFKKIIDLVEKADVPSMTHMRQRLFLDGSTWDISVARNGIVEKASIRCPDANMDDSRKASLVALGKLLNEYAGYIAATQRLTDEPQQGLPSSPPEPTQMPAGTSAGEETKQP